MENAAAPSPPRISVVICTHNRAPYLRQALASVLGQDFPAGELETIVVDNGSTDDTAQAVAECSAAAANVRYVFEPVLGLCQARNTGWRHARGRYVAYLDDDAVALPGWLASISAAFATVSPMPGVIGGRVEPIWETGRPPWLSDDIALSLTIVDWCDAPKLIPDVRLQWLVGANMAVPRTVLAEIGGFHPWLDRSGRRMLSSGDVFLQQRIIERGYACLYYPAMAVRHLVPASRLSKRWFIRRYYWQGVSDVVMQLIEHPPSRRQRLKRAARMARRLMASPAQLLSLTLPARHPDRFARKCFGWLTLGHIAGLLGAAGR